MSFLRIFFALLNRPFHKLIYFFSGLFPRDNNLWLVGAQKKAFSCNSKYFFLEAQQKLPSEVKCYWVSRDKKLVKYLVNIGLPAVYASSFKGFLLCLRAKVYFVNCDVKDVSFYLSRKALVFNLWHGIPLKKIQFDNKRNERNVLKLSMAESSLIKRIAYPFESIRYWRILSTSGFVTDYSFSSAFGVSEDKCLPFGYPRTDSFFVEEDLRLKQIERLSDRYSMNVLSWIRSFDKSYVYMPTWRDSGNDFIVDSGIDFYQLQSFLAARNECFVIKLHPYTKLGDLDLKDFPNIKILDRSSDIYPILSFIDVLITDYSSIYFDFLLLNRPIIFFAFDFERYLENCRDMYFDYNKYTPGVHAYSFCQLLEAMIAEDEYMETRKEVRKLFWGDYSGGASQAIIEFVLKEMAAEKS